MSNIVPIQTGGKVGAIIPQTFEDVQRIAKMVADSGLAPYGMDTQAQICVAIMHGAELGLPPMSAIQKVAVINGRPSIWGDAIPALLWARGFKLIEKELIASGTVGEVNGYECTVIRPDGTEIKRKFTRKDAKDAGLWNDKPTVTRKNRKTGETYTTANDSPWFRYPIRMLQMRARGLAARDGAADVLSGLYLAEEAQDIAPEVEPIHLEADPEPAAPSELDWLSECIAFAPDDERPTSNAWKANGGGDTWAEVTGQIHEATSRDMLRHLVTETYADEIAGMPFQATCMLSAEYIIPKWEALE